MAEVKPANFATGLGAGNLTAAAAPAGAVATALATPGVQNFGAIATDMNRPRPFATISHSHMAGTAVMPNLNGGTAPVKPQGWVSKVGSAIKTNPGKAAGIAAAVGAVTWVAHEMGKRAGANEAQNSR